VEPPALLSVYLLRRPQCSPTIAGNRGQGTGDRNYIQLLISPCNILAISLYSVLHTLQVHSSTYPRSRQYLDQTLISSADPTAILRYRIHSAVEYDLLPKPSAMFAHIDLLAFLICWPRPYCSTEGNSRLALCIAKEILYALWNTSRSSNELCSTSFILVPVSCTLLPDIRSFGTMLSPVKFSARYHWTSELLRFL
jgi:hypothetical protein